MTVTKNSDVSYEEMARTQIRAQIQAEIGEDQETIDKALVAREQLNQNIATWMAEVDAIRVKITDAHVQVQNLNKYLVKVDSLEEEVTRRYEAMLAVMRGDFNAVKKPRKRSGSSSSSKKSVVDGYHAVYAIDGKPAKFATLTHLTYRLNKKLDEPIGVPDLREAWEDQTGYELFGTEHIGQTATIQIEDTEITIGLVSD